MPEVSRLLRRVIVIGCFLVASCGPQAASRGLPPTAPDLVPVTPTVLGSGCSVISAEPTPAAILPALAAVTPDDFSHGSANAPVTLVEYCHFQTPICQSMAAVASNLIYAHPNDLRFVFRPVPIQPVNASDSSHDKSPLSVQAALAAAEQGHFWEMYDALFQKSNEWTSLNVSHFEAWLDHQAAAIGLDRSLFRSALINSDTQAKGKALFDSAVSAGL